MLQNFPIIVEPLFYGFRKICKIPTKNPVKFPCEKFTDEIVRERKEKNTFRKSVSEASNLVSTKILLLKHDYRRQGRLPSG